MKSYDTILEKIELIKNYYNKFLNISKNDIKISYEIYSDSVIGERFISFYICCSRFFEHCFNINLKTFTDDEIKNNILYLVNRERGYFYGE